jgi:hypothetical protein
MAQLPNAPQSSAVYTLTGPDGSVAVFNDPTSPNYIGPLEEITGFESPEVRENADNLVQMDGGIHGDFFYGRRPITMSGKIINAVDATDRNTKLTNLEKATNAMRGDSKLVWTPDGGEQVFMNVRRQQPLRVTGGWIKDFQISLVSADPRIYSTTLYSTTVGAASASGAGGFSFPMAFPINFGAAAVTGQILAENRGNALTYPVLTINGPGTNPSVYNATTNQTIALIYTLAAGESMVIDTLNRTVLLNGVAVNNKYGAVDFLNTSWWGMVSGINDLRLIYYSYSTGASLRVDWRDAWI